MVGDTNSVSPKSYWQCHNHWLVFSQKGSRADARHPLKPFIANFYHAIATTIMIVNTGGTSPSPVHPFSHCVGNFDQGSKPVVRMWSQFHINRILWHPCCLAESQDDYVSFLLKLGHDKLSKCTRKIVSCGHHGHKKGD
jgi:hypothetical protein